MYNGGLIDKRKEKKDYSHKEIVALSSMPEYTTRAKALKEAKKYKARDQKSTSSCGAHAGELALSIDTGKEHEPAFIYRLRVNYKSEGMFHYDIGDILKNYGACLSANVEKTEEKYNQFVATEEQKKEAKTFSGKDYVVLEDNKFDIDDIAYILNTLKRPLILFVFWNGKEWSSSEPVVNGDLINEDAQYRHYVTALPNSAYIYKKKKYFIIQDSSHFGGEYIRHVSEDWVNKRIYTGLYQLPLKIKKDSIQRYKGFQFLKDLKYGDENQDVLMLQTVLQSMGYFPANIKPTGYFGGITRQAVKDFQKAYEKSILWSIGLKLPTGYFYKSTRNQINSLLK